MADQFWNDKQFFIQHMGNLLSDERKPGKKKNIHIIEMESNYKKSGLHSFCHIWSGCAWQKSPFTRLQLPANWVVNIINLLLFFSSVDNFCDFQENPLECLLHGGLQK